MFILLLFPQHSRSARNFINSLLLCIFFCAVERLINQQINFKIIWVLIFVSYKKQFTNGSNIFAYPFLKTFKEVSNQFWGVHDKTSPERMRKSWKLWNLPLASFVKTSWKKSETINFLNFAEKIESYVCHQISIYK